MGRSHSKNKCCKEVKSLTQLDKNHRCSNKECRIFFGSVLNNCFNKEKFKKDEKYQVCKLYYFNCMVKLGLLSEVNNNHNMSARHRIK